MKKEDFQEYNDQGYNCPVCGAMVAAFPIGNISKHIQHEEKLEKVFALLLEADEETDVAVQQTDAEVQTDVSTSGDGAGVSTDV